MHHPDHPHDHHSSSTDNHPLKSLWDQARQAVAARRAREAAKKMKRPEPAPPEPRERAKYRFD